MKKNILDTSILITDPQSFKHFHNSEVILPIATLNELDKLKKQPGDVGRNARVCIKMIDEISNIGDISTGVLIDNNIIFKVDTTYYDCANDSNFVGFGDPSYGDTSILASAYSYFLNFPNDDVTLISNDINLRIKAKSRGLQAEGYDCDKISTFELYQGFQSIVDERTGQTLQQQNTIDPIIFGLEDINHNEFIIFENDKGDDIAAGRKVSDNKIKLVKKAYPWGLTPKNKEQTFAIDLIMDPNIDLISLIGKAGTGKSLCALAAALELVLGKKAYKKLIIYRPIQSVGNDIGHLPGPQPLDAKILTPTGWLTMGEIKEGSYVISRNGQPTKVLGVFPKGEKQIYKITTTDGTSTECCEDHLWYTETFENRKRKTKGSVKTTKEIINTFKTNNGNLNHYLPRNESVHFDEQKVFIPPYLMGCILGDGSSGDSTNVSNTDIELINRIKKESMSIGCDISNDNKCIVYNLVAKLYNNKPALITNVNNNEFVKYNSIGIALKNVTINRSTLHNRCTYNHVIDGFKYEFLKCENRWQNPIKNELFNLKLQNVKAWNKFIPDIYKYNSVKNRVDLLQGLMDTDGTIKKNGEASFCTTSKQLATDIIELVRSLGGRATLCSRNRIGKGGFCKGRFIYSRRITYEFTISLPKHINPFYISRKANLHDCKYIHAVKINSIELVGKKEAQCILVENPEHLYITDDFIVTHNTIEEKLAPWFQAIMDNLEFLLGTKNHEWRKDLEMWQKRGVIEMDAITFIRGRSIPNSLILLDEAQNLTRAEIKTILTRAGENTKIILTGDLDQIDSPHLDASNNGLTYIIEKFKNSGLSGHITLTQGERSRLASKAAEIL